MSRASSSSSNSPSPFLRPRTRRRTRSSPGSSPEWRARTARGNTVRGLVPPASICRRSPTPWRAAATRPRWPKCGGAGTPPRPGCTATSPATWSLPTRARASWVSPIPARCGAPSTTCRPTISPARSIASGARSSRSMIRSTATCGRASRGRTAARWCRKASRSPPTCSATCGLRTGPTSTRSSHPTGADPGFDLTDRLRASRYDAIKMVRTGESFFTSLGFAPLPDTFWQRSMIHQAARPRGGVSRECLGHRLASTTFGSRCASR